MLTPYTDGPQCQRNIEAFKHQNTFMTTTFEILHIFLNCHISFYFSNDFLSVGGINFKKCRILVTQVFFLRLENFGNLLSPSWWILNISEGQLKKEVSFDQNIGIKNINSMRSTALSSNGIFSLIIYWECPQETSKYKLVSKNGWRVKNHVG